MQRSWLRIAVRIDDRFVLAVCLSLIAIAAIVLLLLRR